MYVACQCGYDSGDEPDVEHLVARVKLDGGQAESTPRGIVVVCPHCGASDDRVRID